MVGKGSFSQEKGAQTTPKNSPPPQKKYPKARTLPIAPPFARDTAGRPARDPEHGRDAVSDECIAVARRTCCLEKPHCCEPLHLHPGGGQRGRTALDPVIAVALDQELVGLPSCNPRREQGTMLACILEGGANSTGAGSKVTGWTGSGGTGSVLEGRGEGLYTCCGR